MREKRVILLRAVVKAGISRNRSKLNAHKNIFKFTQTVFTYLMKLHAIKHTSKLVFINQQANSENCGPPPGNNFDLEEGQRSRSLHGVKWKGFVTRIMHAKYQCFIINTSEDMGQVKVFVTDGRTEGWTDRRKSFNVPRFRERRGGGNNLD